MKRKFLVLVHSAVKKRQGPVSHGSRISTRAQSELIKTGRRFTGRGPGARFKADTLREDDSRNAEKFLK